jgi:hypothetical protein
VNTIDLCIVDVMGTFGNKMWHVLMCILLNCRF